MSSDFPTAATRIFCMTENNINSHIEDTINSNKTYISDHRDLNNIIIDIDDILNSTWHKILGTKHHMFRHMSYSGLNVQDRPYSAHPNKSTQRQITRQHRDKENLLHNILHNFRDLKLPNNTNNEQCKLQHRSDNKFSYTCT